MKALAALVGGFVLGWAVCLIQGIAGSKGLGLKDFGTLTTDDHYDVWDET